MLVLYIYKNHRARVIETHKCFGRKRNFSQESFPLNRRRPSLEICAAQSCVSFFALSHFWLESLCDRHWEKHKFANLNQINGYLRLWLDMRSIQYAVMCRPNNCGSRAVELEIREQWYAAEISIYTVNSIPSRSCSWSADTALSSTLMDAAGHFQKPRVSVALTIKS